MYVDCRCSDVEIVRRFTLVIDVRTISLTEITISWGVVVIGKGCIV